MVFKLPKPKRRVNEKMTLEALHRSAETYREMYDDIRKKNDILQKQLEKQKKEHCIAIDGLRACLLNCRNYFTSNNLEYFVNQIDKALDIYRS